MALGKLFGYFRKFAQNFPSQCCACKQRGGEGEKDRRRGREVAKFCQSCHLHSFASFRQISGPKGGGQLARCCCCCQQSFMCLLAKYMRDCRQRGEKERGRDSRHLALGRAVRNSIVKLARYHRLSTRVHLLASRGRGGSARGRGRYKNISLIYCGLNKLLGKAANRQTN